MLVSRCERVRVSGVREQRVVLGATHIEAGECDAFAGLQYISLHVHRFAQFGSRQKPAHTHSFMNADRNSQDIQVDRHGQTVVVVNQHRSGDDVGHRCSVCACD